MEPDNVKPENLVLRFTITGTRLESVSPRKYRLMPFTPSSPLLQGCGLQEPYHVPWAP